jgi:hypothetical protein
MKPMNKETSHELNHFMVNDDLYLQYFDYSNDSTHIFKDGEFDTPLISVNNSGNLYTNDKTIGRFSIDLDLYHWYFVYYECNNIETIYRFEDYKQPKDYDLKDLLMVECMAFHLLKTKGLI